MKKILLIIGLLFVSSPVLAFTETWGGEKCEYVNYLSRCCNDGNVMYYADNSETWCHIDWKSNACLDDNGALLFTHKGVSLLNTLNGNYTNSFTKELYYKGKSTTCPVRMIYRNPGNSPIAAFAHYENDVLLENQSFNTPKKAPEADFANPTKTTSVQTVNNKTGQTIIVTVNKPVVSTDGIIKPKTTPALSNQYWTMSNEQMLNKIKELIAMINQLQAKLAATQGK